VAKPTGGSSKSRYRWRSRPAVHQNPGIGGEADRRFIKIPVSVAKPTGGSLKSRYRWRSQPADHWQMHKKKPTREELPRPAKPKPNKPKSLS